MLILILQAEKDKLSWSSGFALQEHPKKKLMRLNLPIQSGPKKR